MTWTDEDHLQYTAQNGGFTFSSVLLDSDDFEKAKELIIKADEELGYAHSSQTSLIQGEAANDKIEFSLLLVHAQDHLMTTMTFKDLAVELIEVYEKIDSIN